MTMTAPFQRQAKGKRQHLIQKLETTGRNSVLDPLTREAGTPELAPRQVGTRPLILASSLLQRLHDEAPADRFTLAWLMGSLRQRSFGVITLLLAVAAIAPGISVIAGLFLMVPAFQMIADRPAPFFPRSFAVRPLPTRRFAALVQRAVPVLRYVEKLTHPRWHTPPETTKRVVGAVVMMLSATLIVIPIPLSNVVPALIIALISVAYLEEDGLLLSIALLSGLISLAVEAGALWGAAAAA